jgi:transcriptional regulator with GAF, ATPase, and Fis domain
MIQADMGRSQATTVTSVNRLGISMTFQFHKEPEKISLDHMLNDLEYQAIIWALSHTKWCKQDAADLLGMNRTTLIARMYRLGLMVKEKTDVQV